MYLQKYKHVPLKVLFLHWLFFKFLSRRARENKGILQKLEKEKMLLRRELFDRIKGGKLFHKPQGDYMPVGFDSIPVLPPS